MATNIAADPATWFTNQLVDETDMRTNLTDPINYLYNGVYRAKSTTTSGQSITDSTTTILTGFAAVFNVGMTVAGNGITVPIDGDYDVHAWLSWTTNATGRRAMRIQVNGADLSPAEVNTLAAVTGANTSIDLSTSLRLVAGDKVQTTGLQTSGAGLAVQSAMLFVGIRAAN